MVATIGPRRNKINLARLFSKFITLDGCLDGTAMGRKNLLRLLMSRALYSPPPPPPSLSSSSSQNHRSYPAPYVRSKMHADGPLSWGSRFLSTVAQTLSITDSCVKRLQEIIKEEGSGADDEKMLRVSVEGGGCSGFQYVFALDDKLSTTDRVYEKDGVKVVVDEISINFIKGATIDYVEELIRASFMVTQNPNASGGCGCGSSFNVK